MDTSDPKIEFDENGFCNHCSNAIEKIPTYWPGKFCTDDSLLKEKLLKIKESKTSYKYDAILGLSGGVDSCYTAYILKQLNLNPLVVHVDGGWNSEIAVSNIHKLVSKLELDLITIVIDWEEMKDLQVAYLRSGLINQDVPQDHAFFSSLYKVAKDYKIKYVISGSNFATESILPRAWGYTAMDGKNIKAIHKKFGQLKVNNFPIMTLSDYWVRYVFFGGQRVITPLNFVNYNKESAKEILKKELDWIDYGGKHRESVFTEFFQHYFLIKKFGIDKRRAHLSSLIVSEAITRSEALNIVDKPVLSDTEIHRLKRFIETKLDLPKKSLDEFMGKPSSQYDDFANDDWLQRLISNGNLAKWFRKILKY